MPKPRNLIPSVKLNLSIPEDLYAKLTLQLYSELEGRVPLDAFRRFFTARLTEYFRDRELDLAPFAGTEPGVFVVRAAPETLRILERALKGEVPV